MTTDKMCEEALRKELWVADEKTGSVYSVQAHKPVGCYNQKGYLVATLHLEGERKQVKLHRVIWIKIYGIPPIGKMIDHINGKKDDNRIENLRLADPILNSHNRRSYEGEGNPAVKINKIMVSRIRKEYGDIKSYSILSKKYKVSRTLIAKIIRKEIWKN